MIVIIGGGLAGLTCARCLLDAGLTNIILLEAQTAAGGVVQTDLVEAESGSYLLDRGFQVTLDSYDSVNQFFQIPHLRPQYFSSEALIWVNGKLLRFANPLKEPGRSLEMLRCGLMTKTDIPAFAALGATLLATTDEAIFEPSSPIAEMSTFDYLQRYHFSEQLFEGFFRPFFGGVLLDNELESAAPLFRYYLKKFITGKAFVPSAGVGSLAAQLWDDLHRRIDLRLGTAAVSFDTIDSGPVERAVQGIHTQITHGLATGGAETIDDVEAVVLAVDETTISRLLPSPTIANTASAFEPRVYRSVAAVYFWSDEPLYQDHCLVLPAGRDRLVRHFCQISNVNRHVAPQGKHLLSATILEPGEQDDATLFQQAREEISEVFPKARELLRDLHVTRVPQAIPRQVPPLQQLWKPQQLPGWSNVFLAGHATTHASLEGAMASGARAARLVQKRLAGHPKPRGTTPG